MLRRSPRRGRRAAVIGGIGLAALAVVAGVEWRDLRFEYRCLRLDRSRSEAEARPWWDAWKSDLASPGLLTKALGRMGPGHPGYTFWLYHGLDEVPQEFLKRIGSNPELLRLWVHYLRWAGLEPMEDCLLELEDPLHNVTRFDVEAGRPAGGSSRTPQGDLSQAEVSWFLGIPERQEEGGRLGAHDFAL